MRWGWIALYSGLLAGAAAVAMAMSLRLARPSEPKPLPYLSRVATDAEQLAILSELRSDIVLTGHPGPMSHALPVLLPDALWFCPGGRRPTVTDDCGEMTSGAGEIIASTSFDLDFDARPGVPRDFRLALIDVNQEPRVLPVPDSIQTEQGQHSPTKNADDHAGVLHVTRPVVSQDGGQALLYAVYRPDPEFAVGVLFRLVRTDGQWQVQNAFTLWMT